MATKNINAVLETNTQQSNQNRHGREVIGMTKEQAKTIQTLMEQLELLANANQCINLQTEPELLHKNILAMVEIAKVVCQSQF